MKIIYKKTNTLAPYMNNQKVHPEGQKEDRSTKSVDEYCLIIKEMEMEEFKKLYPKHQELN